MIRYKRVKVGRTYFDTVCAPLGKCNFILIKGEKGYIMCGYLNLSVARRLRDAAVKVTGVTTVKDVIRAKVVALTPEAKKLGIYKGQPIRDVLKIIA